MAGGAHLRCDWAACWKVWAAVQEASCAASGFWATWTRRRRPGGRQTSWRAESGSTSGCFPGGRRSPAGSQRGLRGRGGRRWCRSVSDEDTRWGPMTLCSKVKAIILKARQNARGGASNLAPWDLQELHLISGMVVIFFLWLLVKKKKFHLLFCPIKMRHIPWSVKKRFRDSFFAKWKQFFSNLVK